MINRFEIFLLSTLFINIYGDRINQSTNACELSKTAKDRSLRFLENKIEVNTEYDAGVGQMPWMAILWSSNSTPANVICNGLLVNRYYVLSAAACKDFADMVRLGETDLNNQIDCDKSGICAPPPQDIKIKKYIFPKENSLDIIIELADPVKFNDFVRPACLPDNTISNRASQDDELIVGWYGQSKLRSGNALLYTGTHRISMERCKEKFPLENDIAFCIELSESMTSSRNGLPNKNLGSPVIRKVAASNRFFFEMFAANYGDTAAIIDTKVAAEKAKLLLMQQKLLEELEIEREKRNAELIKLIKINKMEKLKGAAAHEKEAIKIEIEKIKQVEERIKKTQMELKLLEQSTKC